MPQNNLSKGETIVSEHASWMFSLKWNGQKCGFKKRGLQKYWWLQVFLSIFFISHWSCSSVSEHWVSAQSWRSVLTLRIFNDLGYLLKLSFLSLKRPCLSPESHNMALKLCPALFPAAQLKYKPIKSVDGWRTSSTNTSAAAPGTGWRFQELW